MTFHIITLFPEVIQPYLNSSIVGRSIKDEIVNVSLINFRDFSKDKHHKVDDTTYGGGAGMILTCEPLYEAIKSVWTERSKVIFLTPQGKLYDQKRARQLADQEEIILICGYYEGFDARIFNLFQHEKISIGDYILTNGGLSALVVLDSLVRLQQEVLNNPESVLEESFTDNLLEYDQYTKPHDFKGNKVPDVLLNGNHKEINEFRRMSSLKNTLIYRPEFIENKIFNDKDIQKIITIIEELSYDY